MTVQADLDLIREAREKAQRWAQSETRTDSQNVAVILERLLQEQEEARGQTFEEAIRALPREMEIGVALDLIDELRAAGVALSAQPGSGKTG